jgi:hypothetical protein
MPKIGFMEGMVKNVFYHHFNGTQTIVCCILLTNGCTAIGKSDCIDPDGFSESMGKNLAYDDAYRNATELMGFHVKANSGIDTSMLLDENGNRSIFDDVDDMPDHVDGSCCHSPIGNEGDGSGYKGDCGYRRDGVDTPVEGDTCPKCKKQVTYIPF